MNTTIREYLKKNKLICDGAFGTYYGQLYDTDTLPEYDNINHPDKIRKIHEEYIEAGTMLIRTNTFASNSVSLNFPYNNEINLSEHTYNEALDYVKQNIEKACDIAFSAASDRAFVAGSIGPIPYENISLKSQYMEEYISICNVFIAKKVDMIIFETFSHIDDILPAIEYIHNNSNIFIGVQFAVNQFGYSSLGLSFKKLFDMALSNPYIDSVGLNCGVGPSHMKKLFDKLNIVLPKNKYISAFPNAGYPKIVSNRAMYTSDNEDYFAGILKEISKSGISILGGCCGSTPEYTKKMCRTIDIYDNSIYKCDSEGETTNIHVTDLSFYKNKLNSKSGEKLIAVELAPPFGNDDEKLMDAAHLLKNSGVDVLTFPDSPSGRTRADSILVAEKVARETGMYVMPHLCCRDKNAIAIRSQLLGAHIIGINNFLVITGDPVPSAMRQSVKSVFNFDSVGLMNIIDSMNQEFFSSSPIVFGGAINQNRLNLDVEIMRVKKKIASGASFFLTQPAFTKKSIDNLKIIKKETDACILCGIMPLVSKKNALFMKNEMTGIDVPDEIVERYDSSMTKEEGENTGIAIAREIMNMASFCDGYYFSFPFNRVYMLKKIME